MSSELTDLLPVFLAEASGRLERLRNLLPRLETDGDSRREAQRELHTLKGAGRMLKLPSFADLCHELEEVVQKTPAGWFATLEMGLDRLAQALHQLSRVGQPAQGSGEAAETLAQFVRLPSQDLDLIADRATRMRILARGARVFHQRLREVAQLAQEGIKEEDPAQLLAVLATTLRHLALELELGQGRLQRLADAHLEHVVGLQVQPLGPFLHSLARHARELAKELGKELQVMVQGEDVTLDRRVTRQLEEALLHLVRNAVDHGVEHAPARSAAGKPATGTLTLQATTRGARVELVVADDGRGIDRAQVVERAVRLGLLTQEEAQNLPAEAALRLLFTPGFSTREQATAISGRGVGLDAVATACARLGGEVAIASTPGRGTRVVLNLPIALRGEEVLLVKVGVLKLLYPKAAVRQYQLLPEEAVVVRGGHTYARLEDRLIPFIPLARLFGQPEPAIQVLLRGESAGHPVAVAVDAVLGDEEVVVREQALARVLPAQFFAGAAVTASGEPLPLLAPAALAKTRAWAAAAPTPPLRARDQLRVLLVDDSWVTREMERRLLADAGFSVLVAGSAEDALTVLAEHSVDCVITDIEMPGMDGLELTRQLRALTQFAHLPVIVVSTRDRPEDRLAGLAAGADAYLAKQGLDASELVALVRRLGSGG
ncbi:MAG: response regulator [Thermoanaerobaculum sp.]|nr:response regulator [Thermoanaerobaculum sp.]MDW7967364.1 response regulator [Thermoanaerobaculum sp.]